MSLVEPLLVAVCQFAGSWWTNRSASAATIPVALASAMATPAGLHRLRPLAP